MAKQRQTCADSVRLEQAVELLTYAAMFVRAIVAIQKIRRAKYGEAAWLERRIRRFIAEDRQRRYGLPAPEPRRRVPRRVQL